MFKDTNLRDDDIEETTEMGRGTHDANDDFQERLDHQRGEREAIETPEATEDPLAGYGFSADEDEDAY